MIVLVRNIIFNENRLLINKEMLYVAIFFRASTAMKKQTIDNNLSQTVILSFRPALPISAYLKSYAC